jgi:hypothetical protein
MSEIRVERYRFAWTGYMRDEIASLRSGKRDLAMVSLGHNWPAGNLYLVACKYIRRHGGGIALLSAVYTKNVGILALKEIS